MRAGFFPLDDSGRQLGGQMAKWRMAGLVAWRCSAISARQMDVEKIHWQIPHSASAAGGSVLQTGDRAAPGKIRQRPRPWGRTVASS